jgi:MFS family permease
VNPAPRGVPAAPLYTRTFWMACALHFTGAMSHGMFLLFPLFIRFLGGNELTIGFVLGTGLAVSVAVRPMVGALLDRFGRRRVLLWSGAVNAASFPLFLLLRTPGPSLFVLAIVHLVVAGALFAAYFTYAADLVPAERRAEGIAIFGVAGMAPNGLGPTLGEVLIARAGFAVFFWVAAGFALVSLALTALAPERRPVPSRRSLDPVAAEAASAAREMARTVLHGGLVRLLVATVVFGAGIDAAWFFVAPFTRDLGIARAAPFFVAYASSTIVLRIFGRRLPDRLGAHRIAVPAFGLFALGLGALCLIPRPGLLVLAGIACGAGHGSLFPVLNALAVERTPARLHGTVVSLYTGALDLGGVLGTPLCGGLARAVGYRIMFACMALTSLAGLGLMRSDRRARHARSSLLVVAALLALASTARADWPRLASGPLQDDSFLIEEAYNQERGVIQHILDVQYDRKTGDWLAMFTQEWPVPNEQHQLSFTVPYTWGEATGVGDVLLNYRYQALSEAGRRPAFAPRVSLILPTGSFRDELGTGSAGVQLSLPLSKQLGDHLAGHLNLGTTVIPHALALRGRSEHLVSGNGGGSLIWEPADAINLLCEFVTSRDQEVAPRGVTERTRATINPGIRVGWNGPGGVQWVWGVGLPVGLTADTDHLGVFLYFSVEHAITREARAKREW